MAKQTFKIPADIGKTRLDHFLVAKLEMTRSKVQKLIKDGFVTIVGEESLTVHHWLEPGEQVMVVERPASVPPAVPKLEVIAEEEEYLVLNKPVGVIVHPATGSHAPVLTEALTKRYPKLAKVGQPGRPGIVHRLDRDVSGALVVAKTQSMYDWLTQQFRERQVKKVYTALVPGAIARDEGDITFVIARSKTNRGRMAARLAYSEGKAAKTSFIVRQRFVNYTLLEVRLHTGRSHQIRAHFTALGHPIVGDTLYGARPSSPSEPELPRLFLEATTLGFSDPLGEWHEYQVPLNPVLEAFLTKLA